MPPANPPKMRALISAAVLLAAAHAHGDHGTGSPEPSVPADANWMTKHMAGKSTPGGSLAVSHHTRS